MDMDGQTWDEPILLSNPSSEKAKEQEGDKGKDKVTTLEGERGEKKSETEERARERATTWLPVVSFTGGNRSL